VGAAKTNTVAASAANVSLDRIGISLTRRP
jgi:hypothetical protein